MRRPPPTSYSKFNKLLRVTSRFPQKGKGTNFFSVAFSLQSLE